MISPEVLKCSDIDAQVSLCPELGHLLLIRKGLDCRLYSPGWHPGRSSLSFRSDKVVFNVMKVSGPVQESRSF